MDKARTHLFLIFLLTSLDLLGQVSGGQFFINGDFSFFNNHDKSERMIGQRTMAGESVPAYDYFLQQYASDLTFNPRVHYFINEKWSAGFSFGFRKIISKRFVDEYTIAEASEYISFLVPSLVQNTTKVYSPKIEIARHWQLNKRLAINLTGVLSWRWVSLKIEEADFLDLTKVEELSNWSVSSNGLEFTPNNPTIVAEETSEQTWSIGVFPQLRYAITSRFGLTGAIGGLSVSQKVKDEDQGFLKAAPSWSLSVNPSSWTFGVYGILGRAASKED